jgi:hypothetical protein
MKTKSRILLAREKPLQRLELKRRKRFSWNSTLASNALNVVAEVVEEIVVEIVGLPELAVLVGEVDLTVVVVIMLLLMLTTRGLSRRCLKLPRRLFPKWQGCLVPSDDFVGNPALSFTRLPYTNLNPHFFQTCVIYPACFSFVRLVFE